MSNYQNLSSLINQGNVELLLNISPPRCGSTMLQTAISRSNSVTVAIADPKGEDFYEEIYSEVLRKLREQPHVSCLVKLMTHWVEPGDEYKRLFDLTNKVSFFIRNPLLSTESRIKKFIGALDKKVHPQVFEYLRREMDPMVVEANLSTQRYFLNNYAQSRGFESWNLMTDETYAMQDYRMYGELLKTDDSPTGFSVDQLGWSSLINEFQYLSEQSKPPLVIDATEFRLSPTDGCKMICHQLGVEYRPEMISGWEAADFTHLITETSQADKEIQYTWYDTLTDSSGVKPPTEKSPELKSFPELIQIHLRDVALPAYIDLFRSEHRLSIDGNLTQLETMREIDPLFYTLTANKQRSKEGILRMVISGTDYIEDDFQGRRK